MTSANAENDAPVLIAEWPFPTAAALGSSVRAAGIERELRARLAFPDRKRVGVEEGRVRLRIPKGQEDRFASASGIVSKVLDGIDALPVLPSEVEDILAISSRERMKWTKDGRLVSAGTRTVTLRGRAKAVTFHVFDPRHVEDVLDRDLPTLWREEDVRAASENRRRAAAKTARARAGTENDKAAVQPADGARRAPPPPKLDGWDTFALTGLLR